MCCLVDKGKTATRELTRDRLPCCPEERLKRTFLFNRKLALPDGYQQKEIRRNLLQGREMESLKGENNHTIRNIYQRRMAQQGRRTRSAVPNTHTHLHTHTHTYTHTHFVTSANTHNLLEDSVGITVWFRFRLLVCVHCSSSSSCFSACRSTAFGIWVRGL